MKVFYLHGMGGSPQDWESVIARCPGKAVPLPHGLLFEETALAMAQSLSKEAEPFLLCGYSMGGRLAIRTAALLHGSSLQGLALLAPGLGFESEDEKERRRISDENWAKMAEQNPAAFWEKWYAQELFSSFHALPELKRLAWLKNRLSINIDNLSSQFRLLGPTCHPYLLSDLLSVKKAGISVLYIAGERDKKYSNLAKRLEGLGVPVCLVEGGHILPLEAPKAVAAQLQRLLEIVKNGDENGKKH